MKKALVLGAGGFIGSNLTKKLHDKDYYVVGVDLKYPEFNFFDEADFFIKEDLRNYSVYEKIMHEKYDEIYQLAADMGGALYIFTGDNDADIMHNSASININLLRAVKEYKINSKIFYASSACVYPAYRQDNPDMPDCRESSVYPAEPDSMYGWEKLFSENLYLSHHKNYDMDIKIARFHNIFGPNGTYVGGKEKAPSAICRKVIEATDKIEIIGDGKQTRSFLYIDECLEGIERLMNSSFTGPFNIGSEEKISINDFARLIIDISGKNIDIVNVPGPTGVRGRVSDNSLIYEKIGWKPSLKLRYGIEKTYKWIEEQIKSK